MPARMFGDNEIGYPVSKGFVQIHVGLVHYVRQGRGPALVMLHAAPCSSKVMAPLQAEWAPHFTTFAFDLPGFGLSDPLQFEPLETAHLADTIAAAIRALGLDTVTLYGRHTGAGVAVEIARRHPDLCAFVLTDGYPVFGKPYDAERLAQYLTPIVPNWDGCHLTWCWFRYREQHMFWPWDKAELGARADTDLPSIDFLYRGALELLEARRSYAATYASAFRHPGLKVIGEVEPLVCYGNRPGDSQFRTTPLYPDTAWVEIFPRDTAAAAEKELAILREHGRGTQPKAYQSRIGTASGTVRDYIASASGPLHARMVNFGAAGTPTLFLHDLPGGIDLHLAEIERLSTGGPVLGFDLSGNGNSARTADGAPTVEGYAEEVAEVLDRVGWDTCRIHAHGTSAAVAVAFALRYPSRVLEMVLRSPPVIGGDQAFAESYAPDIAPEWSGGNFLKLWHHLRDQELWWPWFERTVAAAKRTLPRIDPEMLTDRAVTLLKQPANYQPIWSMVLRYDLPGGLRDLRTPCSVVTAPCDLFAFAAQEACATLGLAAPIAVPDVWG